MSILEVEGARDDADARSERFDVSDVARRVGDAVREGRDLVVGLARQARGVRERIALAACASAGAGVKILVATATHDEARRLASVLDAGVRSASRPAAIAVVDDWDRYLCRARCAASAEERRDADGDRAVADAVREWARTTKTGDVAELPIEPPRHVWRLFSVGLDECALGACTEAATCFARRAVARARRADVIVMTHRALWALAADGRDAETDRLLGDVGVVVLDDAHLAAGHAREALGWRVTYERVRDTVLHLAQLGEPDLGAWVDADAVRFFTGIDKRLASTGRARVPILASESVDGGDLVRLLRRAGQAYCRAAARRDVAMSEGVDLLTLALRCAGLANSIARAGSTRSARTLVCIERDRPGWGAVRTMPADVGDTLRPGLLRSAASVIACATVSCGTRVDLLRADLGMIAARTLVALPPPALTVEPQGSA
jgi:hypothetical protein